MNCGCKTKKNVAIVPIPYKTEIMKVKGQLTFPNGEGVGGSNIVNLSQPTIGAVSDLKGNFEIKGNPDDIIQISHIVVDKELRVKLKDLPSKIVVPDSIKLEGAVVNVLKHKKLGYGLLIGFGLLVLVSSATKKTKKSVSV